MGRQFLVFIPKGAQNSIPEPDLKEEVTNICAWGLVAAFSSLVFLPLPLRLQTMVALEKSEL